MVHGQWVVRIGPDHSPCMVSSLLLQQVGLAPQSTITVTLQNATLKTRILLLLDSIQQVYLSDMYISLHVSYSPK